MLAVRSCQQCQLFISSTHAAAASLAAAPAVETLISLAAALAARVAGGDCNDAGPRGAALNGGNPQLGGELCKRCGAREAVRGVWEGAHAFPAHARAVLWPPHGTQTLLEAVSGVGRGRLVGIRRAGGSLEHATVRVAVRVTVTVVVGLVITASRQAPCGSGGLASLSRVGLVLKERSSRLARSGHRHTSLRAAGRRRPHFICR